MAVVKRFSIARLMAVVFFIAVDFAIVRALWGTSPPRDEDLIIILIVVLPVMNLLLIAAPKLRTRGPTRPFWIGFEGVGWTLVVLFAGCAWNWSDDVFQPIERLNVYCPFRVGSEARNALVIVELLLLYTTPLLLASLLAGRLVAKYRG